MTITLDLPPDLETTLLAEAQAKGMSVDEWVREVLVEHAASCKGSFSPRRSRLWDLRQGLALGDTSIKDLIAEGRE